MEDEKMIGMVEADSGLIIRTTTSPTTTTGSPLMNLVNKVITKSPTFSTSASPIFGNMSTHLYNLTTIPSDTTILPTQTEDPWREEGESYEKICLSLVPEYYDPTISAVTALLILTGLLFVLSGYRCFKAILFLSGFLFGTAIVYLICTEEDLLPGMANVSIALTAGFLFGLITMLVNYVGLFMLGFQLGILPGLSGLLSTHLIAPHWDEISPPDSIWFTFLIVMASGLVFACSALYFQKGCTILGTCFIGSTIIIASGDYFVENFNLVHWVWKKLKQSEEKKVITDYGVQESIGSLCPISIIFAIFWIVLICLGLICQWCGTGRGNHHSDGRRPSQATSSRRNGLLDLQKIRQDESKTEQKQRKYRYLYQVRTAHGDVISQKKCLPGDEDSLRTYNSDASHFTGYNGHSDSRTTTMSHLP